MADFSELVGQTIKKIIVSRDKDSIFFLTGENEGFVMYHSQDCCESVSVEDIAGDLNWLIGTPVLSAYEATHGESDGDVTVVAGLGIEIPAQPGYIDDAWLWTFYRISTIKGTVVIRWYGTSNGYYSVNVYFNKIDKNDSDYEREYFRRRLNNAKGDEYVGETVVNS